MHEKLLLARNGGRNITDDNRLGPQSDDGGRTVSSSSLQHAPEPFPPTTTLPIGSSSLCPLAPPAAVRRDREPARRPQSSWTSHGCASDHASRLSCVAASQQPRHRHARCSPAGRPSAPRVPILEGEYVRVALLIRVFTSVFGAETNTCEYARILGVHSRRCSQRCSATRRTWMQRHLLYSLHPRSHASARYLHSV